MLSISAWKGKATASCTMVMTEQLKRRLQNLMTLAAGMTALIVVLPLIVVVEISLQLHLCPLCLLVVLINVKSLTALGFVRAEQVNWTKEHMRCA
jgi:hypothetical protein